MVLTGFVALQIVAYLWVSYLDRSENRAWVHFEEFSLRCSSVEKAGKSTLHINTRNQQFSSISRIAECDALADGTFSGVQLFVRFDQNTAFGIRLDDQVILEPEASNFPNVFFMITLLFLPVFGLWINQHRKT